MEDGARLGGEGAPGGARLLAPPEAGGGRGGEVRSGEDGPCPGGLRVRPEDLPGLRFPLGEARPRRRALPAGGGHGSLLSSQERSVRLRRWYELMMENKDELARIITAENVSTAAGPSSAGGAARCRLPLSAWVLASASIQPGRLTLK